MADLVWIPQSLRNRTLDELNLRFDFLLGKAKLTPNADRWKNWSGEYKKVYVSKNQKKKQQAGQELALVSLADFDGFFKTAKHAETNGQHFDNGLQSVGKKTLLSWSASAASRVGPSDEHSQPASPVMSGGVRTEARAGGSVSTGVSQSSSSMGQAKGYPPNPSRRGGQNPAVKVGGPSGAKSAAQLINDLSVDDLVSMLIASGISESELNAKIKATQ